MTILPPVDVQPSSLGRETHCSVQSRTHFKTGKNLPGPRLDLLPSLFPLPLPHPPLCWRKSLLLCISFHPQLPSFIPLACHAQLGMSLYSLNPPCLPSAIELRGAVTGLGDRTELVFY